MTYYMVKQLRHMAPQLDPLQCEAVLQAADMIAQLRSLLGRVDFIARKSRGHVNLPRQLEEDIHAFLVVTDLEPLEALEARFRTLVRRLDEVREGSAERRMVVRQ